MEESPTQHNESFPQPNHTPRDALPLTHLVAHADGSLCPFSHATGKQSLSPATVNVDQKGIYHTDGTRCLMFTFTHPRLDCDSSAPTTPDKGASSAKSNSSATKFTPKESDSDSSVDADVELESVLSSLTAPHITPDWIRTELFAFMRRAYGAQTLRDGIKNNSVLQCIEQADMLATVLEQLSGDNYVLQRYRAAVLGEGNGDDEFGGRLAGLGMHFGVFLWVLCEARKKGSLRGKERDDVDGEV